MPFWKLYYHLVWGTKNRQRLLTAEIEPQLYQFITNRALEMDVFLCQINGYFDHVHVVAAIPPKHAIATAVKILKGASSHHINDRGLTGDHFSWQRGYDALSLGEKQLPIAVAYVANQKQHHEQANTNNRLEQTADYDEGPLIAGSEEVLREAPAYSTNIPEFP